MSIKDEMINMGFTFSSCRCGGVYTEKYTKGRIIIRLSKKRFTIKNKEDILYRGVESELISKVNEIVI